MSCAPRLTTTSALAVLACAVLLAACAADDAGSLADEYERPDAGSNSGSDLGGQPDLGSPDAGAGPDVFVPEEPEEDFRLQPPTASQSYVYVANTDLNAVARIDSVTLEVRTLEVGFEPTIVATTPNGDLAVVLNHGSSDVSVIPTDVADTPVLFADVVEGANSLVISPSGEHAVAWYDERRAQTGDRAGSLNDATLVDLRGLGEGSSDGDSGDLEAFNLVVGLNIREVEFDDDGETAFFITDDGVSVVELDAVDADRFVPPVRVSTDPLEDAQAVDREVEITPDGQYALVRTSTASNLRLVTLADGTIAELELGAIPTDVDLLPAGDRAVAVLRELGQVAVARIPEAFASEPADGALDLFDVGAEIVGLALPVPGRDAVALYSTLDDNDHLSLLDWSEGVLETWALRKGIESVYASPDGSRLLVLHTKQPGAAVPGTEEFLARSYGYSIVGLDAGTTRLILTEAQLGDFTFSADGEMAFLLVSDPLKGIRSVEWVNLMSGRDETISLRREPEAIGTLPATGRVFVSQSHEVGRMAFIDPETGEVREVTGYHLNSRTE